MIKMKVLCDQNEGLGGQNEGLGGQNEGLWW